MTADGSGVSLFVFVVYFSIWATDDPTAVILKDKPSSALYPKATLDHLPDEETHRQQNKETCLGQKQREPVHSKISQMVN